LFTINAHGNVSVKLSYSGGKDLCGPVLAANDWPNRECT